MNAAERQLILERQRAFRALLLRPLLLESDPTFVLVRRHAAWIGDWVARYPRWSLQITPELARLRKTPGEPGDGTRPARDPRTAIPLTPRRYALFCLLLAVLERSDRQITLGRLVERLEGELALEAEIPPLQLQSRDQRRDLVLVVRLLLEVGALRRVAGDEADFLDDAGKDALYTVSPRVLVALLDTRHPPSLVTAPGIETRVLAILAEPLPDTEEGRNAAIRAFLYRRLLDDPVVYFADLSPEERAYLGKQRPFITREIALATGLIEESRKEGLAMVDPEGTLSDIHMPEEGTEGHLTLLLAGWLSERIGQTIGFAALEVEVRRLVEQHRKHWKKEVGEPGAEVSLSRLVVLRLLGLGLLRLQDGGLRPEPALCRYRVKPLSPPSPLSFSIDAEVQP